MVDQKEKFTTDQLNEILKILRSPEGCPWDREQTHKTIRNDMIEETYEAADAIDQDDTEALCEELGDMLLQVVFHSAIAQEDGEFTYDDVVDGICRKLILRHPHVFGNGSAENSEQVLDMWDKIKKEEKHQTKAVDTLKSVPKAFPALMRASKVQKRAIKAGMVLENPLLDGRIDTLIESLKKSSQDGDAQELGKNYGDLLFLLAGLQNFYKNNCEELLNIATNNFIKEFGELEDKQELKK